MNIVKSSVEFVYPPTYETVLMTFNTAARNCYKSETENNNNMKDAEGLAKRLISLGHGSPIEMNSITVKMVVDRAFLAQVTRQRLASFAVQSQRYVNYSKDKFGHNVNFIVPAEIDEKGFKLWEEACRNAEQSYFDLLEIGYKPEVARSVLPNCTATEIVMSANIREWRHIFELRCDSHAQTDIRLLMTDLLQMMYDKYLVFFEDIYKKVFNKENE